MNELFLKIINMSISASWLVLAVLLLRLVLKKAPKWINVLLWGIIAVRLICPFTIESPVSLIPDAIGNGELVSEWMDDFIDDIDIHHQDSIYYDAAIGAGREPISDGEGGYYVVTKHDQLGEPATVENSVMPILSVVWIAGITFLVLYTAISYWHLRRRIDTAVLYRDNIFQSENVSSPFVLGIVKPKIYLPFKMDGQDTEHVVAHEQAHIQRKDHWWKPLGFLLLTIHWFNPLMWLAYVLLCRDIELACDEKVIQELDNQQRANYTQALVTCSVNRRMIAACPLAFGEIGVKERVKSVMNYKKPVFWITMAAIIAILIAAVCLLTNSADNHFLKIKRDISGTIIEANTDDGHELVSFVLQTDDNKEVGILLTDETYCFSFVEGMDSETFKSNPQVEVLVSVECYRSHKSLLTDEGNQITAYDAEQIIIDGYKTDDTVTLQDGTNVDIWYHSRTAAYTLQNGVELLSVQNTSGPDNVYVAGVESLDDIDEVAKNNIIEFFHNRGLLYDTQAELEKAYANYLKMENEFDSYMIGQEISPSASTDSVIYFLTTVFLPIDGSHGYKQRIGTAFDKTTGEPIDNWDLFSCPPDEAMEKMMDIAGVDDTVLRSEMKAAFVPENVIFFQDNLEICFQQGTLPSQEHTCMIGLDYDDRLGEILYEWAIPRGNNES